MKTATLEQIPKITNGILLSGKKRAPVHHVNFGKYKHLRSHHLYIYTRSKDWTRQLHAIQQTPPLAVVLPSHISNRGIPPNVGIIKVNDPFQAYWRVARWNWKHMNPKVIGITGSAGKSTTTEMVASILKQHFTMVKTVGNLNTFSFLPSYLCKLEEKHSVLLLEMGMKSLNNIGRQCRIVSPHIGVVTNVGEAHVGSLGDLNAIVKAKQEMVDGVRNNGILYINADDERSQRLKTDHIQAEVKTFGIQKNADIQGRNIKYQEKGMNFEALINHTWYPFTIPTFGIHNVYNALAAIGIATSMKVPVTSIKKGLSRFRTPRMRLQILTGRSGRTLINDAWNANPAAMKAGLKVLQNISHNKPTVAVLGDMLELGRFSNYAHKNMGRYVANLQIDQLVTIGARARLIAQQALQNGMSRSRVFSYMSHDDLTRHIAQKTAKNSIIYFKGSRKLHLEKVVKKFT